MKRTRKLVLGALVASICIAIAAGAWVGDLLLVAADSQASSSPLYSGQWDAPDYPNAREVTVYSPSIMTKARRVEKASDFNAVDNGQMGKDVRFITTDRPEQVLTFYKDVLVRDGWTLNPRIAADAPYFFKSRIESHSDYTLQIVTQKTTEGQTLVEIRRYVLWHPK